MIPSESNLFISIAALIISLLSLYVAFRVAWESRFKSARIVGHFSYLLIWRFRGVRTRGKVDRVITPYFWLSNVGARPLLIEDIRLILRVQDRLDFKAYPVNSVPLEAIEIPAEFHDYERLRLGGPFSGFSLAAQQQWISSYHYHISDECYGKLKGDVKTYIQYRTRGKRRWHTAFSDLLQFGSDPYHFRELKGKEQAIFIYPKRWKEREE